MDRALSANIVEPDCSYGAIAGFLHCAIARVHTGCAMHPSNCQTLVELLCHHSSTHCDRRAFTFLGDGETESAWLTYAQLDRQARAIAARLQARGASGRTVLLLYPPGLDYLAAFFGCLYAAAIAVPAYPPRNRRGTPRILALVEDARPAIALTVSDLQPQIASLLADKANIDNWQWLATDTLDPSESDRWRVPTVTGDTIAFLQYTSGSTGTPKGVEVTHGNLLHNAASTYDYMGHSPESVFVSWLPTYHDMGLIGGILQPLYGGFPCVLMPPATFLQRPYRWLRAISHYRGTTSGAPNFAYDLCVEKISPQQRSTLDLGSWEVAFNGAEPVRSDTLERFADCFAPCGFRREAFYPCYGMAEATLMVSGGDKTSAPTVKTVCKSELERDRAVEIAAGDADARSLVGCGRTLPNQTIAIAHPQTRQSCRPGEVGEIWVRGPSIARGYWRRDEPTRQTFRAYLADTGTGPFLRTGDLGFLDERGELFVTGRVKDLIIIRGRNLYPQDLELTAYRSHPALRAHGGAAFSIEVGTEERLAIVQELEFRQKPDPAEVVAAIREAVAQEHEVSVYAVVIIKPGRIPKTSSGKIQRRATRAAFLADELPVWTSNILDSVGGEERGDRALVALQRATPDRRLPHLKDYLKQRVAAAIDIDPARVALDRSLSALGLDSLRAFELKNQLERDLNVAIDIADLFEDTSLDRLADRILARESDTRPAVPIPPSDLRANASDYPLSRAQRQIWFLTQLQPDSPVYNLPVALQLRGQLDLHRLERAIETAIARHEALRACFRAKRGEPTRTIAPELTLEIPIIDWQHLPLDRSRQQARELASELARTPFDLEQFPLWRWRIVRVSPSESVLIFVAHHTICDGRSIELLLSELSAAYGSRSLSPVSLQDLDVTDWQNRQFQTPEFAEQLENRTQQLSQSPPALELPMARSRPPVQTFRGASHQFKLSGELTAALRTLSRQENATLFMTLLAAFKTLLYRYSGQTDLLVGSPIANRDRPELEDTIGLLINVLVLRTQLSGEISFRELLARVRSGAIEAYQHRHIRFDRLVERLQPQRDPSRNPLFQVMFALQDSAIERLDFSGLTVDTIAIDTQTAKFDLSLYFVDSGNALSGTLEYNTDLFDGAMMELAIGHFQTLLDGIIRDRDRPLSELPLLPHSERQQLLVEWNQTERDFVECSNNICEQFEARVAQQPEAIAVVFEDRTLTYRQLNDRADRLASYLQQCGVRPDTLVGICLERSLDTAIGLLGILKAGGAYVPIDPNYPTERIALMLSDARPPIILTQTQWVEKLPEIDATVVCLDRDWETIARCDRDQKNSGATAENLAYVIYTSGSTGTPKGVRISRGAIANFLNAMRIEPGLTRDDILLAVTTISFDIAALELFLPLTTGARVVVASRESTLDGNKLAKLLARSGATVMQATPATWTLLLTAGWTGNRQLKLLSGGEALPRSLADRLLDKCGCLWNLYGPTETTVWSAIYPVQSASDRIGIVPIGRPIANTKIYLLDDRQQPVSLGVPGEVYIGGAGVAKGYLNRPKLSDKKFVSNPFGNISNDRLYRTGDLACYRSDRTLEYLGRRDNQVKIRGFRIELGEIEAILNQHSNVRQAVATVRNDRQDPKSIVAYVVRRERSQTEAAAIEELRRELRLKLPGYMIPAAFVFLDEFPLTPNGKIDRRSLPDPEPIRQASALAYTAPKTSIERAIATVWQELLPVDKVGIHDNFFDLGGHSLLLVRASARLQEILERDLSAVELFQHPTVAALAKHLSQPRDRETVTQTIDRRVLQQKAALNRQKQLRQRGKRIYG